MLNKIIQYIQNQIDKIFSIQHTRLTRACNFSGLFVIDDKGNLRQITINDLPVGRSVDEALRLVQAFQYTDKHGEGKICFPKSLLFNTRSIQ